MPCTIQLTQNFIHRLVLLSELVDSVFGEFQRCNDAKCYIIAFIISEHIFFSKVLYLYLWATCPFTWKEIWASLQKFAKQLSNSSFNFSNITYHWTSDNDLVLPFNRCHFAMWCLLQLQCPTSNCSDNTSKFPWCSLIEIHTLL